jgi:hypothetical protein
MKEPWCLCASDPNAPARELIRHYARRWRSRATFATPRTCASAWGSPECASTARSAATACLLFSALAVALLTLLGPAEGEHRQVPHPFAVSPGLHVVRPATQYAGDTFETADAALRGIAPPAPYISRGIRLPVKHPAENEGMDELSRLRERQGQGTRLGAATVFMLRGGESRHDVMTGYVSETTHKKPVSLHASRSSVQGVYGIQEQRCRAMPSVASGFRLPSRNDSRDRSCVHRHPRASGKSQTRISSRAQALFSDDRAAATVNRRAPAFLRRPPHLTSNSPDVFRRSEFRRLKERTEAQRLDISSR